MSTRAPPPSDVVSENGKNLVTERGANLITET